MRIIPSISAVGLISSALLLTASYLSSCTKTNTRTVTKTDTVTVTAPPSRLSLLTGKEWELDTVYWSYTGPGTGSVVYIRGGANNSQNLDNFYSTFTANGDWWAVENGTYFLGKWNFTDSDSTMIKTVVGATTEYDRFLSLTATKYVLYDSAAQVLDVTIVAP